MADESLSAFISVETDAADTAAQISELPSIVGRTVSEVNSQLQRLAQENPFARLISDSERATLSIAEITQAAEAAAQALAIVGDANARLQEGAAGPRISGAGGISLADIEAQNVALREQLALLEREAELSRLRLLPPTQTGANGTLAFTGGTQPGTAFISDAEAAEAQRTAAINQARATLLTASRSNVPVGEDMGVFTQVPISIREDFTALANAMAEGAAQFEGKSIIAVRTAWAGVNGTIEPGFYNARTGQPLSAMDQLYHGGKSTFMGGGGGGGGGFFSNFGQGFTGGGDSGGLGDLGQQAGVIARYVVLYQVFREVEKAIKDSVDQALTFDRAITDLSNRLEISKQEAQGLATNIGLVGAQAGLAPSETVGYAASYAGAFQGQSSATSLLGTGAQTAAQVQILTGNVKEDMPDVIAAIQAFNLNFSDTQRVLDAATSAAQNYGLANAHDVLPGLAQIGDLAIQSGFSLEQTANALADIQTRTHDSSAAVAGQLQRFLGREGNAAFQQVFAQQGISTSQPFAQELAQLSAQYDKLSDSQKNFITAEFGGGRAGVAALAFIEDYQRILNNTTKSLNDGGVAQKNYANRLGDIVGVITAIRGDLKELAKDVGTSGIGSGFGLAVEAAKPLLEALDEMVRLVNFLTSAGGHFTFGRDIAIGAAELVGAVALLQRLGLGGIGRGIGRVFGRGGGDGTSPTTVAADATTTALNRLTEAVTGTTEAMTGNATAAEADAAAKATDAAATEADAVAKTTDAAATELDAATKKGGFVSGIPGLFGASGFGGAVTAGGLAGAALSPAGIIAGIITVQAQYDHVSKIIRAIGDAQAASTDAFIGGNDAVSLQSTAQKLREQAQKAESSSGGFLGSFDNAFGAGLGYVGLSNTTETTGDVASRLRAQAALFQLEATRAQAAQATSTSGGDFSSLIDLGKQGGIAAGLKTLTALGLDSAQQLDALNEKLADFAAASSGAANYLAKGASALAAQNYANAVTNDFIQVAHGVSGQKLNPAEQRVSSKGFLTDVAPGLNQAINDAVQGTLQSFEGGAITHANNLQIADQAKQAMIGFLEAHGFSKADIANLNTELNTATLAAVQETIAVINAAKGQAISPDAVGAVVQALPGLLSGTAQEITQRAQLGQIGPDAILGPTTQNAPQGTQVAGLQAALKQAENTYKSLSATPGTTSTQLQTVRDQIVSYRVQIQTAIVANIQSLGDLAAASIPPENQTQQIAAHIATVENELASTANPDEIRTLTTDLKKSQAQLAQSQAQDIISGIGVGTDPRDAVQTAKDAAARAAATVANDIQRGVTGQALNNAETQASQANYAATAAGVAEQNARLAANARSGNQLSEARASLKEAENSLNGDLKDTTQYWQDLKAVHDAMSQVATDLAQQAKENSLLHGDTTDPVAQARANLKAAQTQLSQDRKNKTGDLVADQLSVEQAQQAEQKAKFDQQLQVQQNAYDLQKESTAAYLRFLENQDAALRKQLAGMKRGQEGYQQRLDELNQIDQAIKSVNQQQQGMWNIGDIKIPTPYEAERYIKSTNAGLTYNSEPITNTSYNFQINGADVGMIRALLQSLLGPIKIGTTSTAPRKV